MGCSKCNEDDKEIGKKIQEIMESNQNTIDYLNMKCNYLQMMLLNTMQYISFENNIQNFENFQNNFHIYQNQLNNKSKNNNNSNFKIENQKIITLLFEANGKCYSVITPTNAGLKEVYYIFFNKIQDQLYSNINKLKFIYNAKNITNNFINNDRLDSVLTKHDNQKISVLI